MQTLSEMTENDAYDFCNSFTFFRDYYDNTETYIMKQVMVRELLEEAYSDLIHMGFSTTDISNEIQDDTIRMSKCLDTI